MVETPGNQINLGVSALVGPRLPTFKAHMHALRLGGEATGTKTDTSLPNELSKRDLTDSTPTYTTPHMTTK